MEWKNSFVYNKEVHESDATIVHKSHMDKNKFENQYNKETDTIICTVRNYKESAVGHNRKKFNFDLFKNRMKGYGSFDYMHVLKIFDENENPKLMVYYEDLISNPEKEIKRLIGFLGGETGYEEFIQHIHGHKRKSFKIYGIDNSKSKGEDLLYYSKHLDIELKLKMDEYLEAAYPELFNKYLKRYA